jgi:NADPH:quinone reductase-like Zn-dependent oxidoreductase
MKALVTDGKGGSKVIDVPEPELKPNYVKFKNLAVALNPSEFRHMNYSG